MLRRPVIRYALIGLLGLMLSAAGYGLWATRAPEVDAGRVRLSAGGAAVALADVDPDLLDPQAMLPQTHRYDRAELSALVRAGRACADLPAVSAPLNKTREWCRARCGEPLPAGFFANGPLIHPLGGSFAGRARALGFAVPTEAETHVLERRGYWADLGSDGLDAIRRGTPLHVGGSWLWIRVSGGAEAAFGPHGRYRVWPLSEAAHVLAEENLRVLPGSEAACLPGPDAAWCLAPRIVRSTVWVGLGVAFVGGLGSWLIVLLVGRRRERQRAEERERFVLRTLAHELRTPATAISLNLEPLRREFDALPDRAQTAVLRLADQSTRLQRVLNVTSRWVRAEPAATLQEVPSVRAVIEDNLAAFGDDIGVEFSEDDRAGRVDPDGLGVCLSNLVSNALRHGQSPVTVRVHIGASRLHIAVEDGGQTEPGALAWMRRPFERSDTSRGLGLGLSLVDRLASGMGGRLTHSAHPTTFTLELPA